MKKMLLATAWPCLLQDVLNRRFSLKQTGGSNARNHHPSFSSFLELGKLSMQPKFVAQKMLLKQKPSKHS